MAWGYYASITVDHTKVSTADHTDFPILVSGTYDGTGTEPDLRHTTHDGNVTSTSGFDIAFFSDEALTTQLSHEIESYNHETGAIIMHVKIPTLHTGSDDVIYMAYGNESITTDPSTTATWNSNFLSVYHLKEASGTVYDSTGNNYDGTSSGSPAYQAVGKVGYGMDFERDTSDYVDFGDPADTTKFTIEAWTKMETLYDMDLVSKDAAGDRVFMICFQSAGSLNRFYFFILGSAANVLFTTTGLSAGTWYYIVGTFDEATDIQNFYRNTVLDATASDITTTLATGTTATLRIGRCSVGEGFFDGIIDEVRFSNTVRTAGWITTTYNTINAPSTFYTMGEETAAESATNIEVTPSAITTTSSLPTPTIAIGDGATPAAVVGTLSLPAPEIVTIKNVSVSSDVITATISLPSPLVEAISRTFAGYNSFKVDELQNNIDLDNDTLKVALVTSGYTFDKDTHAKFSDITNEATGIGYDAGGTTLMGIDITLDTTNDLGKFNADNTSWDSATFTARGAVIYKDTGTPSTSPLVAYFDFGSNQSPVAQNFTIQWNDNGIIRFS